MTCNEVFAASPDDPRARRPVDVSLLVVSMVVLVLGGWAYRSRTDIDRRVFEFLAVGLPGWISGTFTIMFILGGPYAAWLIIGIAVFGHGHHALVRDMLRLMIPMSSPHRMRMFGFPFGIDDS